MGKANRKKRRRQKKANPKQAQSAHHVREKKALWRTASELLGAIATVLALALAVHDAFHEPEIHASAAEADHPFDLHFSLLNPSLLFRMSEMGFICGIDQVRYENGTSLSTIDFAESDITAAIEPGRKIEYSCPFDRMLHNPWTPIVSAKVRIVVNFKTLGVSRKSTSEEFTWTVPLKRWVEGTIVN